MVAFGRGNHERHEGHENTRAGAWGNSTVVVSRRGALAEPVAPDWPSAQRERGRPMSLQLTTDDYPLTTQLPKIADRPGLRSPQNGGSTTPMASVRCASGSRRSVVVGTRQKPGRHGDSLRRAGPTEERPRTPSRPSGSSGVEPSRGAGLVSTTIFGHPSLWPVSGSKIRRGEPNHLIDGQRFARAGRLETVGRQAVRGSPRRIFHREGRAQLS
jgi:hypothetical protein